MDDDGSYDEGSGAINSGSFYGNQPQSIADAVRRQNRRASTATPGASTRNAGGRKPKLKLKLSEKATAAMASGTSFLGPYDRELDSDDEDLSFEEQFILRMHPGEDCEKIRKLVQGREVSNDVWFKFKDSRRAVFHVGNNIYAAKLVDLPCIIESQKTLDNKQMFKVADICQMLVMGDKIPSEDVVANQKGFNIDEFIWPHGITPPLHHVRKRRFRKRVNKRTIETVEQEVERLLEDDARADQVSYTVLENVNPDLSDSEFMEQEEPEGADMQESGIPGSDAIDAPTPGATGEGEEEDEGEFDEDLAAELDLAMQGNDEDEEGEDEEDEEEGSDEDEEDDEDDDAAQERKLLNEEIRDLEAAVAKKNMEISSSANPLIRRRFEDALRKLQSDLESKVSQRDELSEQTRIRKEIEASEREKENMGDMGDTGDMDVD